MWVEIFKSGTWKDSHGREKTWTDADLNTIVAKYDPASHEAPVVIGHPQDNAPAYGWVEALKREGHTLFAKLKDLVPEFVTMVKERRFPKRSMSVYPDMTLRHIGFLGAMPPAVKGLADLQFNDAEEAAIYEFEESNGGSGDDPNKHKGGKSMKFMDWLKSLASEKGVTLEDMPQNFTEADIANRVQEMVNQQTQSLKGELDQERARTRKLEAATRRQDFATFCDGLLVQGKLTTVQKGKALDFMEILHGAGEFEFAEGGKKSAIEEFKAFLGTLPKQIEFSELARKERASKTGQGNEAEREKKVQEYMDQNKDKSYKDAVLAVSKDHPELFEGRE